MLNKGDIVSYEKKSDFRSVVLEEILKLIAEKGFVKIIILSSLRLEINKKLLNKNLFVNEIKCKESCRKAGSEQHQLMSEQSEQGKLKVSKIAIPSTTDLIAYGILNELINGKNKNLKKLLPVENKVIKPLYLFLDKEVLLYAKLKKLKFKKLGSLQSCSRCVDSNRALPRFFTEGKVNLKKFLLINKSAKRLGKASRKAGLKSERGEDKIDFCEIVEFINELEKKHPEVKRAVVNGFLKLSD